MYFFETCLFQEDRHLLAAAAVVTDRDDIPFRIELLMAGRDFAHRDEMRARDARSFELPGLAHVEQQRFLAPSVGEACSQILRADLFHG